MKTTSVYKTQVKTFGVARALPYDWRYLRILPAYRNELSRLVRHETAKAVVAIRRSKGAFPPPSKMGVVSPIPTLEFN